MSAVSGSAGSGLYEARRKIHAREVTGRYERLRVIATSALLGLFYGLPWLQWRGHQAVLFDLPARKFHILGLVFFPQDFFLLTWLLIIAAVALFFFTTLGGRLWCGYACPQTVWTKVFVAIERWCEGDRQQRIKLDRAPWTAVKVARKTGKQILWVVFAAYTGLTFVGYFSAIRGLAPSIATASLGGWETFWILFYGFATYGNAGYMREQVCKYMCPYARFQSAMFDRNTLIISYDAARGEPRGSRSRGADPKKLGLGDCIDCTLCVQACPTGIDIREGLQLECIACAACIDACDGVMQRMRYASGLIRYATQNSMDGKRTRIVRPRTLIYGGLLMALIVGFGVAVAERQLLEMDVMRDRNSLYRQLEDGGIENVYTIRLINKDTQAHVVQLGVSGLKDATLDSEQREYRVAGGEVLSVPVRVRAPGQAVTGSVEVKILARSVGDDEPESSAVARFVAPST
ncbi:MAG TPA: cytochrome c oxidase accessory protein CcoG [Steroidobacteraceae bacterium]|jgi:cytochrome c oxidase accessory protein FixG